MKNFKKVISVVLAVVMMLSCMSILGFARNTSYTPTIIIPGLFQSETYHYVNGEKECDADGNPLPGPFYVSVSEEFIAAALTEALIPVLTMFATQQDKDQAAAKIVAELLSDLLMGKQASDANGNLDPDVRPETYYGSFDTFSDVSREHMLKSFPVEEYFDIAGEDNLYVFNYVSTGNMIQTAQELYDYIQFVKKDTGAQKVNIVPVSQGGSIANALMQLYVDNGSNIAVDVNRIVFAVPALDGANLLGDCYTYGINDESAALYTTMFTSLLGEDNVLSYVISLAVRLMPKTDVSNLIDVIADTLVNKYLRYSTLMWGLIPSGQYPTCRDKYLAGDEMAEIRRQADWYYNAQLKSDFNIITARSKGVEIFDIVDTNVELYELAVSHSYTQADGIIQVDSTSMGAYSVNVGTRLPAGYKTPWVNNNCILHEHIDPEGIIDAHTGLLPDHTFYFSGQNHATTASNDVLMSLIIHLLTDESFTDVFSYPDKFPQFNKSRETLQLRKDVATMKEYDTSSLSAEDKKELDGAIKQVEDMLANTVIDVAEYKAANDRFYAIYDKIMGGEEVVSSDSTSKVAVTVIKGICDGLYEVYGDAAYSEIPFLILSQLFS